jgi:outer membrane protein
VVEFQFGRFRGLVLATISASMVCWSGVASAESLSDAFAAAYMSNPSLRAERARLRATDESVPQALSGWRPTISAQGDIAREYHDTNVTKSYLVTPKTLSISLSQPIFRGFRTVESTKVAEANVKGERAILLSVEQGVLLNATQAYLNVVRDRKILGLRQTNVKFLKKQLQASEARFAAGELTRTDVAQSRASVSGAQATVAVALANLKSSEANYKSVVGRNPGKLQAARMAKRPESLDRALAIAQETNPKVLAAAYSEEAATHVIEVNRGELMPTLTLDGQAQVAYDASQSYDRSTFATVKGVLSVPLYEGGRVYSTIRQAKQTASQKRIEVIGEVRAVRENVTNAWNGLIAYRESLSSVKAQVAASQLALDGVRQEYLVGSRTTIDVLNAQQALLTVQVNQIGVEHDQILGSYQLLAAMGHLTAERMGVRDLYDPTQNYDATRGKWIGLSADTVE